MIQISLPLLYSAEVPASTRRCNERWLTHLAVWPCVSLMNGPGPSAAPVAKQHSRWRSATFCEFGRPFNRQAPRGPLWRTITNFWAQNRCYSAPVKAMKDKTTLGRRIVVTPLPQSKRSQGQCNLNCLSYTLIRSSAREGWLWVLLLEPSPCRAHPWPSLASQGV